jgi:predicted dehydrogenase
MESRRRFLQTTTAAALAARSVMGANDRVQIAIIGTGNRIKLLGDAFFKQPDCTVAAAVDVYKSRLDQFVTTAGRKMDTYGDYRRVLDRKDIDAIVITTPDHWHAPIMVAACEAGKDVYVEKPVSNSIPAAVKMLEAAQKYNRVVQVGTQQRSWAHFQECARMIQDGAIGNVSYVLIQWGGGPPLRAARPPETTLPEGLDWDMWQGPAERRPYSSSRYNSWRSYYAYGGGLVTDWGVHWADIVDLCMKYDLKAPLLASASAQYLGAEALDLEKVPGAFMVTWKYDSFLMSFTNVVPSSPEPVRGGPLFHGSRGDLLVNRSGYIVRPPTGSTPVYAGQLALPARSTPPPEPGPPPIEAKTMTISDSAAGERGAEVVHVRNWLDCIKSRQKSAADFEIGFHSTLPCLLGLEAIRRERTVTWDPANRTARSA